MQVLGNFVLMRTCAYLVYTVIRRFIRTSQDVSYGLPVMPILYSAPIHQMKSNVVKVSVRLVLKATSHHPPSD